MDKKPSYYAITPADVRYDKRLPMGARFLYGEITALSNKKGYCWASDRYFMGLYEISRATVQRWLKSLDDNGYIERHVKYKEGTKEVEERYITIRQDDVPESVNLNTSSQKCERPMLTDEADNTTSINNINTRAFSTLESDKNNLPKANQSNSSGKSIDKKKDTADSVLESNFEKLWKLYPKKIGKKPASAAYKRVMTRKKHPATNKQIQDGIVAYRQLINSKGTDRQFIKDGSTFFNQEAWDDYLEIVKEEQNEHKARKPKFDPRKVAIEMYLGYNSIDQVIEQINAEEIPIDPEDAKRYIAEYKEGENALD